VEGSGHVAAVAVEVGPVVAPKDAKPRQSGAFSARPSGFEPETFGSVVWPWRSCQVVLQEFWRPEVSPVGLDVPSWGHGWGHGALSNNLDESGRRRGLRTFGTWISRWRRAASDLLTRSRSRSRTRLARTGPFLGRGLGRARGRTRPRSESPLPMASTRRCRPARAATVDRDPRPAGEGRRGCASARTRCCSPRGPDLMRFSTAC
jgi:hypothetical protein